MFTEDPAVYLVDWGEAVLINSVSAGLGIFSEPAVQDPLGSVGFSSSAPRVLLPAAGVPASAADVATEAVLELPQRHAAGKTWRYLVRDQQPDGLGWASLILVVHPSQA